MGALFDNDALPPSFGEYFQKALDAGGVWGESKIQSERRFRLAAQQELSKVLPEMKGVDKARVMLDQRVTPDLNHKLIITASVFITPTPGEAFDAKKVQRAVAHSIAGLATENVVVTDTDSGVQFGGGDGGITGLADSDYHQAKQQYEQWLEGEIKELLASIPGVTVKVNAVLDERLTQVVESVNHGDKPIALQSETTTLSKQDQSSAPTLSGRPGLAAQGPAGSAAAQAPAKTSGSSEDQETTRSVNLVDGDRSTTTNAGLTPKKATVAISVPSDYFVKVWREENKPADGAEPAEPTAADLDKIRQTMSTEISDLVSKLLPEPPAGVDYRPLVHVTALPSLPQEPLPEPTLTENIWTWLSQHGNTIVMVAMAAFGFLMLRSIVRGASAGAAAAAGVVLEPSRAAPETETPEMETAPGGPTAPAPKRTKRRLNKGPSLRDDLVDMVQEDPDAAAAILRNWISSAA